MIKTFIIWKSKIEIMQRKADFSQRPDIEKISGVQITKYRLSFILVIFFPKRLRGWTINVA